MRPSVIIDKNIRQ